MSERRYYDLADANAQLGNLNHLFSTVIQLRGQLKTIYTRLEMAGFAPPNEPPEDLEGIPDDLARDRSIFYALAETLKEQIEAICAMGCVIKDVEDCLVDWPAIHCGREIWLCWKYGENRVTHWHEVHEGYSARRSVADLAEPADD